MFRGTESLVWTVKPRPAAARGARAAVLRSESTSVQWPTLRPAVGSCHSRADGRRGRAAPRHAAAGAPSKFSIAAWPRARRIAERPTEHGTQVIFELAGLSALDRPVTRVVDSRRHLVGDEPAFVWKNSTVSTPRYCRARHDGREPAFGLPLQSSSPRTERSYWPRCRCDARSRRADKTRVRRGRLARRSGDTSRSNSTNASAIEGTPPSSLHAAASAAVESTTRWPRPS